MRFQWKKHFRRQVLKVFIFRRSKGGNRYTLMSIVIILLMLYAFKTVFPQKNIVYPASIHFQGYRYEYADTVKKLPLQFIRRRPASEEGFIVLVLRRDNKDTVPEEAYLYQGFLEYRRYVLRLE